MPPDVRRCPKYAPNGEVGMKLARSILTYIIQICEYFWCVSLLIPRRDVTTILPEEKSHDF
jgi:hypothetical protein